MTWRRSIGEIAESMVAARLARAKRREAREKREAARAAVEIIRPVVEEEPPATVVEEEPPATVRTGPPPDMEEVVRRPRGRPAGARSSPKDILYGPEAHELCRFGNAVREFLGLEPLYQDVERPRYDPDRKFLEEQEWRFGPEA